MPIPTYVDFDLEIERAGTAYRAQVLDSPTGQSKATFRLPFSLAELAAIRLRLQGPRRAAIRAASASAPSTAMAPEDFGARLFEAVFDGELLACLRKGMSKAEDQGQGLRIRLRLSDAPELAQLPWEYLYDPVFERFLCLSTDTPLVRFMDLAEADRPLPVEPPLRILVMIASPSDHVQLDVEREWANVKEALGDLERGGLVVVERVAKATLSALQRQLRRNAYHVFHFIGHGGFDAAAGDGVLLLEDEAGSGSITPAEYLGTLLHDHRPLRLVVLNACEGARGEGDDLFAGTAQSLVRQGIPAIIAMQFEVSDDAAIVLAHEFYGAIADNYPVDAALAEARKAIHGRRLGAEWGTPVLYMRASDGRIFEVGPLALRAPAPASDSPGSPAPAAQRPVAPEPRSSDAVPQPPPPVPPLEVPHFVGREAELQHLSASLAIHHTVVITGMIGAGKTAVAQTLARRTFPIEKIFWHAFCADQGADAIIWRMAGFLAYHGRSRVWEILEGGRQAGTPPPPLDILLDYLLQLSRGQGFLIALDDFQLVDSDPMIERMLARFGGAVQAGELTLLVVTERRPGFESGAADVVVLAGMSLTDVRAWLDASAIVLPEPQVAALHAATEGNAHALTLALAALRRTHDPARLISRLSDMGDIEAFLLQMVDAQLTDAMRAAMKAVAVFMGYPGSAAAIQSVLGGVHTRLAVGRSVRSLEDRYLLRSQEGPGGDQEYQQHALVQPFYYGLVDPVERSAMHARAGMHYENVEPDTLKAGQHFVYAEQFAHASDLVLPNVWRLINEGHARELKVLLERFSPGHLAPPAWVKLCMARGDVSRLLGDVPAARADYALALARLDDLERSDATSLLRSQACQGMGTALQYAAPPEALAWFTRGLADLAPEGVVPDSPDLRQAAASLYVYAGAMHMWLADFPAALAALEQGQALLPPEPSQLKAGALLNLASVHGNLGDLTRATAYTREGLAVCEAIGDDLRRIDLLNNLALILDLQGDWEASKANYTEALTLAERLGDVTRQAKLALNLGILATNQGDDATAAASLEQCVATARSSALSLALVNGLAGLADLHLRRSVPDRAEPLLAEAERLAIDIDARSHLPEILRAMALVRLAAGDVAGAADAIGRSLALLRELGQEDDGRSLRVRGQVLAARGDGERDAMMAAFERSAELLAEEEPYEAARTKLEWARALATRHGAGADGRGDDDGTRAAALAREALLAFRGLGAQRDVAAAKALLGEV